MYICNAAVITIKTKSDSEFKFIVEVTILDLKNAIKVWVGRNKDHKASRILNEIGFENIEAAVDQIFIDRRHKRSKDYKFLVERVDALCHNGKYYKLERL